MRTDNIFKGKKAWVTGASSGIGEQLVYRLSEYGASLVISARRADELERVKNNCKIPENIRIVLIDQTDESSVREAASEVKKTVGSIDFLFNNGGISQRSLALETPLHLERRMFEVNFFSNILLSKLVAAEMTKNRGGTIVITSTLLGKWGFYTRSSYAASKHALHGYYDSMRMEVENAGIHIVLVTPGFIATDISKNSFDETGKPTGEMDANQAGGITASECAERMLKGVSSGKKEFGVGGSELNGLWVKRLFPRLFERILRKRSPR